MSTSAYIHLYQETCDTEKSGDQGKTTLTEAREGKDAELSNQFLLGTQTRTDAREESDSDMEVADLYSSLVINGTQTYTKTREESDQDRAMENWGT